MDIENGGYAKIDNQRELICNISLPMNGMGYDPNHSYLGGWVPQYDGGGTDGFCQVQDNLGDCVQMSYVQKSDVQPYFDIATNYGFANYMFQTNEGPSFPAHQFLFTGTSAPVAPLQNDYQYFVGENGNNSLESGCANSMATSPLVDPTGAEEQQPPFPAECYPHDTLVTNSTIGDKGISWRYYTPTPGAIWTAPQSIPEVCYGSNTGYPAGTPCSGAEWNSHLSFPNLVANNGGGAGSNRYPEL